MKNKSLFYLAAGIGLASVATSCKTSKKQMNVLYIMSDDHTSQAIGAYGSRLASLNPTPNIDKLASEGLLFQDCFDTNSISTPSRSCILTGQYSHHNTVLTLDEKLQSKQLYLGQAFKEMGYQTGVVGKWHVGCEPTCFDFYSVLSTTDHGGQGSYFNPTFQTNAVKDKKWPDNLKKFKGYHSVDAITEQVLNWFKNIREKDKPFLFLYQYKSPHDMFKYAPRYKDYLANVNIPLPKTLYHNEKWGSQGTRGRNDSLRHIIGTSISSRHEVRNYVDDYKINTGNDSVDTYQAYQHYLKDYLRCVKGVDDGLAKVFAYLKEAGLWDNTIIIYTGDQGMMLGEHDLMDKRWMYDESERMPFIMRVPGTSSVGKKTDLMIENVDFAPTLIDLVGGKIPSQMDGKSFATIFDGKTPENWRTAVYYRYWMHMIHHDIPANMGVRTKDWKLIFYYGRHYDSSRYGQKSMTWKKNSHLIEPTPISFELYDMKNDPHETTNLAKDPKYADKLQEMKELLVKKRAEVGDNDDKYPEIKAIVDEYLEGKNVKVNK